AGEHEGEGGATEERHELVSAVAHPEPGGKVDQDDRPDHVHGKQQRDGPREEPDDEQQPADQLQEGDEGADDLGQRCPHPRERLDGAGDGELEDLLSTVSDEDRADDDAQDQQSERRRRTAGGGGRHEERAPSLQDTASGAGAGARAPGASTVRKRTYVLSEQRPNMTRAAHPSSDHAARTFLSETARA
ncbi:hypothetical protein ABE10_31490, partial [Bacillus toyonensis]|nr:hypothetical protein [Bacillus toyonensis]